MVYLGTFQHQNDARVQPDFEVYGPMIKNNGINTFVQRTSVLVYRKDNYVEIVWSDNVGWELENNGNDVLSYKEMTLDEFRVFSKIYDDQRI